MQGSSHQAKDQQSDTGYAILDNRSWRSTQRVKICAYKVYGEAD